ncbi:MAG TPA: hypothetical protein V6D12_24480 [Candidatus Obscuribacterales bacterium]
MPAQQRNPPHVTVGCNECSCNGYATEKAPALSPVPMPASA